MLRLFKSIVSASFFAVISGCVMSAPPADLDVRLSKPSANGRYLVTMRQIPSTQAINQLHAWEVTVTTSSGQAVSDARIGVGGGMPQHHHGFPTQPRITDNLGNGRYVLDGVKFSMTGWWQFKLQIDSSSGSDLVDFNTVVSDAPAASGHAGAQ